MNFELALEQALAAERLRRKTKAVMAIVVGLVGAGILFAVHQPLYASMLATIFVGQGTWLFFRTAHALEKLRGGTPELWAPSSSHGVLVVTGNRLIAAGLSVELDRHALHRVSSVSYDEAAHALKVQTLRIVQTRDGEQEQHQTEVIALARSVTSKRGYALAKELLELSVR